MRVTLLGLAAFLVGCADSAYTKADDAYQRADVVRVCADGTKVVRDPQTGRFLVGKTSWDTASRFWLAPGVRPSEVCADR